VRLFQVSCERYDAKAIFKNWVKVSITVSSSLMAYGRTREKAVSRARGGRILTDGYKAIPIADCVCECYPNLLDGRPHVISVSFPVTSGVPEQFFAFASSEIRDSFMRALLQVV
jgi:hypothetical protein